MYLSFSTAVLLGALYAGYALTYLSGHFKYSYAKTVFAIIPVALIAVALLVRKKEGVEPYGDFHRALNEVAGHETLTEWINVGYWTVSKKFQSINIQNFESSPSLRLRSNVRSRKPARVLNLSVFYWRI